MHPIIRKKKKKGALSVKFWQNKIIDYKRTFNNFNNNFNYHANVLHPAKITMYDTTHKVDKKKKKTFMSLSV